jgi:hypothetical protein
LPVTARFCANVRKIAGSRAKAVITDSRTAGRIRPGLRIGGRISGRKKRIAARKRNTDSNWRTSK